MPDISKITNVADRIRIRMEFDFQMGDTILLPATTGEVKVSGTVKFLETFV